MPRDFDPADGSSRRGTSDPYSYRSPFPKFAPLSKSSNAYYDRAPHPKPVPLRVLPRDESNADYVERRHSENIYEPRRRRSVQEYRRQPIAIERFHRGFDEGIEIESDTDDICLVSVDAGGGALTRDQNPKLAKQKADLEVVIGEKNAFVDYKQVPSLALHADGNRSFYNVASSCYRKDGGFTDSSDVSSLIEYSAAAPSPRQKDGAGFQWM